MGLVAGVAAVVAALGGGLARRPHAVPLAQAVESIADLGHLRSVPTQSRFQGVLVRRVADARELAVPGLQCGVDLVHRSGRRAVSIAGGLLERQVFNGRLGWLLVEELARQYLETTFTAFLVGGGFDGELLRKSGLLQEEVCRNLQWADSCLGGS